MVPEIRSLTAFYVHQLSQCSTKAGPSGRSEGSSSLSFSPFSGWGIPCLVVLFSIIKKHHSNLCFPHHLTFSSEPDPSWVSLIQAVKNYVRSTQITHDNFPASSSLAETHLQSPFSHVREHSQVPRMRSWTYLWVEVGDH